jgi:hypothetical protein
MNFPMENPIFQFLYWLVNTPGNGGIAVGLLAFFVIGSVALALRWVATGANVDERETYAYPTPALHHAPEPSRPRHGVRR